jgi:hypothetical protein
MSDFVCSALSLPESAVPAVEPHDDPLPQAGVVVLTPAQKVALLKMRRSDWSKAVVAHLEAFGKAEVTGGDYRALAQLGLAVNKGSFHVLTPAGRRRDDQVAMELARDNGLHAVTYDYRPRGQGAAFVRCTCGWCVFKSRTQRSYALALHQAANAHLQREGALP